MLKREALFAGISAAAGTALRLAGACARKMKGSLTRTQVAVAAAAAVLPLSAVLATMAVSPDSAESLAPEAAVSAPAAMRTASVTVNQAETTASLFARLGISDAALEKFVFTNVDASAFAYPGRGLVAEAVVNPDGTAQSVSLYTEGRSASLGRKVTVARYGSGFTAETSSFAWEKRRFAASAEVRSGTADAAAAAGVPADVYRAAAAVAYKSSKLLASAKKGDLVSFAYEKRFVNGLEAASGKLLAVSVRSGSRDSSLYWMEDGSARGGFYPADGSTGEQSFRRYPVNAFRLTSAFSSGRKHPVLGRVRAHKGVDLAAPRGTPVYAVADGVIKAADRSMRGYGNRIDIRHGSGIETRYAHLAGYAKGIRPGTPVTKGQLIGYCGSTGISTGSHVHYEVIVNGVARNPATVALSSSSKLSQKYLATAQPRVRAISGEFSRAAADARSSGTAVAAAREFSGSATAEASSGRTNG